MLSGVSIISPENTWIDSRATIGRDTTIHPFTVVTGAAVIGENCEVGPHAVVNGTTVANGSKVAPFETTA